MDDADRRLPVLVEVIAAFVLGVAIVVLVLLLRDGDAPRVLLGEYEPEAVEAAAEEALTPVELRPAATLRVTGRTVRWLDPQGRAFLETPRLIFNLRLGAAPDGGVLISDGVIEEPRVRLVETAPGRWNYERPMAPFLDDGAREGAPGPALGVRLRDIRVAGGHVTVDLLDARYEARSLDVRLASADLSGPGVDAPSFHLASAGARLVLPDTAGGTLTRDVTLADARVRALDGSLAFEVAEGTFGASRLAAARGVWNPAVEGLGLDLRVTVVEARLADLPWLPGEVPEGATGRMELTVEPRPGGRSAVTLTGLDVRAPGSSVAGMVRVLIGGAEPALEAVDLRVDPLALDLVEAFTGPLPYGGTVSGTIRGAAGDVRVDLTGRLTTPNLARPFTADVTGRVALTDAGISLRQAVVSFEQLPLAALEPVAPGLPVTGPISGSVRLTGPPGAGPMELDLRLEAGGGIVTLVGTADLSGAIPAYDLRGRVAGVRLQSVLEPAAPPVEAHATFTLEGRGTEPRTADARLVANGTFTGWRSEPGDTLAVRARVSGGMVDIAALQLEVGPISVVADGQWNYVDGSGTIRYEAEVAELRPLAPYLPPGPTGEREFAQGRLQLAGTASGTLDAPVLEGAVRAEDFRWGSWATDRMAGDYRVNMANGLPVIEADLTADRLRSPVGDFDAVVADIDFGRPLFSVEVRADQPGDRGIVELTADGRIDEDGQREVFVRTLELDLQQQRWRLPEPARIAWTAGDRVRIERLELQQTDADGRMLVDGILAPVDDMDLALEIVGLPVGDVLELTGSEIELAGDLDLDGRLTGPAANPGLDVRVSLTEGSLRGVAVRTLEAEVTYDGTQLLVDGSGLLGDSARVRLEGTVPARIQLAGVPVFSLVDDGPIDLQVVTETFPLATLDPGLETAEELEGWLEANVRVTGTPASPRLSGSGRVREGAVTLPMLGRRFENIRGAVTLTGREAQLGNVVVESDGFLRVDGTLEFVDLTNPVLDLEASLERFRAQGISGEEAVGLYGRVAITGPLSEPLVSGSVRARDGAVSLAPLQRPTLSQQLVSAGELDLIDPAFDFEIGGPADAGVRFQNLSVELEQDVWFVAEDARVRLAGTLTVDGPPTALEIQGILRGEGGTFRLVAGPITRQFQIVSSEVRFFGSPDPNPQLDLVASRLVRGAQGNDVDVRIQVAGTLDNPTLSLGTATGEEVPESELLSFLLFGRPTTDLGDIAGGGGLEGALGQGLAYTGVLEAFTAGLTEEISFLDYFRVEYVPGVGLFATAGWELTSDLFLNVDLPLGSEVDFSSAGLEYRTGMGVFRGAYEPVQRQDRLVGTRSITFLDPDVRRQIMLAWRKRWTY